MCWLAESRAEIFSWTAGNCHRSHSSAQNVPMLFELAWDNQQVEHNSVSNRKMQNHLGCAKHAFKISKNSQTFDGVELFVLGGRGHPVM